LPAMFNDINPSTFIVRMNDLKYGIITDEGNWLLQPIYWLLEGTNHTNIFKASINNKFGFINSLGEWIIPPFYDYEITHYIGGNMIWDEINQVWRWDWDNREEEEEEEEEDFYDNLFDDDRSNIIDNDPLGLRS
jgi:hypothetical protein